VNGVKSFDGGRAIRKVVLAHKALHPAR
jgi:hypothetical protein